MATNEIHCQYDRAKELKDFDETKEGVKGLVDAGVKTVPRMFIHRQDEFPVISSDHHFQVPVIDLQGSDDRAKTIKEILDASEKWGFFQLINHGVPVDLLDKLIQGVRLFNEQDLDSKKEFYNRDPMKPVRLNSNHDLFKSSTANWRDTLTVTALSTGHLDPTQLPSLCREVMLQYTIEATKLVESLLELISEGLGLNEEDNLRGMECTKGWTCVYHYYPACPEPDLTSGAIKHTDPSFLTVLLQDQIGGLQVLHDNKWVNIKPIPGALIVNIGDLLQMITNDKLKSSQHRVVANRVGPRISTAMFFTGLAPSPKVYRPLEELVSEENPRAYREFTLGEFFSSYLLQSVGEFSLDCFRV